MLLGPFKLHDILGKGGMGVVWNATHNRQNVPVAVKILTEDYARSESFIETLENEARAAASMQHGAIATLYDYGRIDAQAAQNSYGVLHEGSPYLVMEMASNGTLEDYQTPFHWDYLKNVLLTLLDALAHAHARGLVHRDLKPANVLVCGENDLRPGLKLTDFGIAHMPTNTVRTGTLENEILGTPLFMAPEQFQGHFRDYGPWTDLYALGCMAYEFATGRPPFVGASLIECFQMHMNAPLPPLGDYEKQLPVGFYQWLQKLCAKNPKDRFQITADAAWALMQLGEPIMFAPSQQAPSRQLTADEFAALHTQDTVAADATTIPRIDLQHASPGDADAHERETIAASPDFLATTRSDHSALATTREMSEFDTMATLEFVKDTLDVAATLPRISTLDADSWVSDIPTTQPLETATKPFPESWHTNGEERTDPPKMAGVGLGLYGLRPIPFAGRVAERNAIWQTLKAVHQTSTAQLILLHGPAGTGKSRLAEWACERAHELGAASILKAPHNSRPGQASALQLMIGQYLNCLGLNKADMQERIDQHLADFDASDKYESDALISLLPEIYTVQQESELQPSSPTATTHRDTIQFTNPSEIWALIYRFFKRVSSQRPLVVWLDDVHWESNSIGFLQYVLEAQAHDPIPVLFLATVRDEAVSEMSYTEQKLNDISALDNAQKLHIGPMSSVENMKLIRSMLGLDESLSLQVEARTSGNPLFSVQLVGDWVERGILEVGDDGFQLRPGVQIVLPDEIYDVWSHRVESLLEQFSHDDGYALELAASLGHDIERTEWDELCRRADIQYSDELVNVLLQKRLAHGSRRRWSWSHGMLRETLARRSKELNRWMHAHDIAAQVLQTLYPDDYRGIAERLGLHFIEAGHYEKAFDYLMRGAQEVSKRSEYEHALYLLTRCKEALTQLNIENSDQRWGKLRVAYANASVNIRPTEDVLSLANEALSAADSHGWAAVYADALHCLAIINQPDHDRLQETEHYFNAARQAYEELGNKQGVADAMRGLGWCATHRAHYGKAQLFFETAMPIYQELSDTRNLAACMRGLGMIARKQGHSNEATKWLNQSHQTFQEYGSINGMMWCIHDLAEIDRENGNLEAAENGYSKTISLMESLGIKENVFPRFNLGLVQVARENYAAARDTFDALLVDFEKQNRTVYQGIAHLCILPCVAALQDWSAYDKHLENGKKHLSSGVYVDPDLAESAELAGHKAHSFGQFQRAADAFEYARQHWKLLNNQERTDKAAALAKSMGESLETNPQ